jgi:hypothetical protein
MHKVDDQNLVIPKAQRNRRVNIGGRLNVIRLENMSDDHTSVFIPSTNDTAAAIINIMRVRSCQASHKNLCNQSQRINTNIIVNSLE